MDNNENRKCSYCGEEIPYEARRCKYCGSLLAVAAEEYAPEGAAHGDQTGEEDRNDGFSEGGCSPTDPENKSFNTGTANFPQVKTAPFNSAQGTPPAPAASTVRMPNAAPPPRRKYAAGYTKPLGNGRKVFLTIISTVIPGLGQLIGLILGLVFMNQEEPDRRSFGQALLVASLVFFVGTCVLCFVVVLAMSSIPR